MSPYGVLTLPQLKVTLEGSEKVLTMDRLRATFFSNMLGLPDVEVHDKRLNKIVSTTVALFDGEVDYGLTCFKKMPPGNQRIVVEVNGSYMVDYNLIQIDQVHKDQAKGGGAICFGTTCGCQQHALTKVCRLWLSSAPSS